MEKIVSMKALIDDGVEKLEFITTVYKLKDDRKVLLEFYVTDNDLTHTKVSNVIDRDISKVNSFEQIKNIIDTFTDFSGYSLVDGVIHNDLFSKLIRDELIPIRPVNDSGFYFYVDNLNFKASFYDAFYLESGKGLKSVEFEFPSGRKQIIILTSKTDPTKEDKIFYFERSR